MSHGPDDFMTHEERRAATEAFYRTAPVSPIATQPFWVVERARYLDGWEKGRPVYVMKGLRPDDHAYTQDIENAQQFPTKNDAAAYLRDNLRDNEAFEVHEHMMVAAPIVEEGVRDALAEEVADMRRALQSLDGGEEGLLSELRRTIAERDLGRIALSSAERRIEELAKRLAAQTARADQQAEWAIREAEKNVAAEALVTTIKAEVEEMKRSADMMKQLLDDANAAHFDATMRADEAEARLASLTGQVEELTRARNGLRPTAWMRGWTTPGTVHGPAEYDVDLVYGDDPPEGTNWIPLYTGPAEARVQDMRTALAPFVQHYESWMDAYPDNHESSTFSRHTFGQLRAARAAIRSLPVLPTTGGGGEDDADLPDPSEVRGILKPTGQETSGEET